VQLFKNRVVVSLAIVPRDSNGVPGQLQIR
jgi:hypothetical protein